MQHYQHKISRWQTRSNGFLSDLRTLEIGEAAVTALIASFDKQRFSDALFSELGVDRPNALNTAVCKRRAEYLAGRAMARAALSAFRKDPAQITIGPNREPIWPKGIAGSITHTNQRCAAMVSNQSGALVGIDIEDVAHESVLDSIFHLTLLPDETHLIRNQGVLPPADLATLVFSAKETLYKALFPAVRQFFGFDYAALDAAPTENSLNLRLTKPLSDWLCVGAIFNIGYQLTGNIAITWLVTSAPGD